MSREQREKEARQLEINLEKSFTLFRKITPHQAPSIPSRVSAFLFRKKEAPSADVLCGQISKELNKHVKPLITHVEHIVVDQENQMKITLTAPGGMPYEVVGPFLPLLEKELNKPSVLGKDEYGATVLLNILSGIQKEYIKTPPELTLTEATPRSTLTQDQLLSATSSVSSHGSHVLDRLPLPLDEYVIPSRVLKRKSAESHNEIPSPTKRTTTPTTSPSPTKRETKLTTSHAPAQRETKPTTSHAPTKRETKLSTSPRPGGKEAVVPQNLSDIVVAPVRCPRNQVTLV